MKKAKRWIVSAGACLLALTGLSVSFGQIPTAPIPEQNNDGLPLLTEPAPIMAEPTSTLPLPAEPADVPAPAVNAVPQTIAPAPVAQPTPAAKPVQPVPAAQPAPAQAAPQSTPLIRPVPAQQPCQQCNDPCQSCPSGAYYSPSPYSGVDTKPWWGGIRPVPYVPAEHERPAMGLGGRLVRDRYGRLVPIEPPFYQTRGPRDFYLDNPRPLGY